MNEFAYQGSELELFKDAYHWKTYLKHILLPHIHGTVLEVGAGIGGTTAFLCTSKYSEWVCLEPDHILADALKARIGLDEVFSRCVVVKGTLQELSATAQFDSILYIDVLEHIENDNTEIKEAVRRLRPGGKLVVLVPAYEMLFSQFDRAIGHYRRYSRKSLKRVIPSALSLCKCEYIDSIGLLAVLVNRLFLRQSMPNRNQIHFWDSVLVRLSRVADLLFFHCFGKSIVGIWVKE